MQVQVPESCISVTVEGPGCVDICQVDKNGLKTNCQTVCTGTALVCQYVKGKVGIQCRAELGMMTGSVIGIPKAERLMFRKPNYIWAYPGKGGELVIKFIPEPTVDPNKTELP